jgi:chemotaxis protein MotB
MKILPIFSRRFLSLCFLITAFSACVSSKKYDKLLVERDEIRRDYEQLREARRERTVFADSLARTMVQLADAREDNANWLQRNAALEARLAELTADRTRLTEQVEALVQVNARQDQTSRTEITDRMKELDARERDLRLLEASLRTSEGSITDLKKVLSAKELKIKQLGDTLAAEQAATAQLRLRISEALKGFSAAEISVKQEGGRIYVVLSDALLFAKGSTQIGTRGQDALKKLGATLATNTDMQIEVEGHTDSDGSAANNWALSQARALSVLQILLTAKVEPRRMVASGRAFYKPVAPNDVEANKAKNRRTEILLSPKIEILQELIKID